MTTAPLPIVAAGCVLWRRTPAGIELCLVHRPKYDDWSHPKGKVHPGETPLAGALREVTEETGLTCTPGPRLTTSHYEVRGRPKVVHYWAAEAGHGHFTPNAEVDQLTWLPPPAAHTLLTHPRDRELADEAVQLVAGNSERGSA